MGPEQINDVINYLHFVENVNDAHMRFLLKLVVSKATELKNLIKEQNKATEGEMRNFHKYEEILNELKGIFT